VNAESIVFTVVFVVLTVVAGAMFVRWRRRPAKNIVGAATAGTVACLFLFLYFTVSGDFAFGAGFLVVAAVVDIFFYFVIRLVGQSAANTKLLK
jgi:uncharacterized membrane protein YozB (DUF420 family)